MDGDDVLDKLLKYEKAHGIKITAGVHSKGGGSGWVGLGPWAPRPL